MTTKKNASKQIAFVMRDLGGNPLTGISPTCQVSKDAGAFAGCANAAVEIGSGWYQITLTATEMNADMVIFKATQATAMQYDERMFTDVNTPTEVFTRLGAPAGASVSADIAQVATFTDTVENRLPAALVGGRIAADIGSVAGDVPTAAALVTNVPNLDAAVSTRLATAGYTAPPTAVVNATTLLDLADGIEVGLTLRGAMRLALAAIAGRVSNAGGTTITFRNAVANTKDRIVAIVDAFGNRSSVTTDVS